MDWIAYLIIIFGSINLIRMAVFLVGSDVYALTQHWKKKRISRLTDSELPTFSVVIPAHNEKYGVLRSITSLHKSDYPKDKLQIIVVDDGSTDDTFSIASKYKNNNSDLDLTVITQENGGKAHALNNGMQSFATGELVMCLDADSGIAPDGLRNAAEYFRDPEVAALSANVSIIPTGTLLNTTQIIEYLVCYQMKRAQTVFNIEYIIGGIGSTFRHEVLKKIGYYDTDTITEDIDLTMKILQLGNKHYKVIYGSDVKAYTESVMNVQSLIRQRYRWKWGRCQTFLKNMNMFFRIEKGHSKKLTWVYLPFALYGDIAFFFEPIMLAYIVYIVFAYGDWMTIVSAFCVVTSYTALNIIKEDTLSIKKKIIYTLISPTMYIFMYILSYVEYVALIKSLIKVHTLKKSLEEKRCGWQHVERLQVS